MGEFGFGNVAHIMTANAYSHVSGNLERVKAWRNSYDSFLTVVQPQPKTAPLPSPVRCCDVGFCLKKYKEANTFDELKCFVGAIGAVFHTRSKFATRHAQDISALRLYNVCPFLFISLYVSTSCAHFFLFRYDVSPQVGSTQRCLHRISNV